MGTPEDFLYPLPRLVGCGFGEGVHRPRAPAPLQGRQRPQPLLGPAVPSHVAPTRTDRRTDIRIR